MTPFWYSWRSWTTELAGGAVLAVVCDVLTFGSAPGAAVAATFLSLFYELILDPNGWSWGDVAQREVGIFLGALVLALLA